MAELTATVVKQPNQTTIRIVHPASHSRKVFDIVGLSKDVGVYEGEGAAVSGW